MAQMGDQPCWSCTKACGGCAWTEVDPQTGKIRFEPIPGWDAETVFYRNGYGTTGRLSKSKHARSTKESLSGRQAPKE